MPFSFRLIHWGLALSVLANLLILEDGDAPHIYVGYFALALVAVRQVLRRRHKGYQGLAVANALNWPKAVVHFSIWTLVALLALTGWMMSLDRFWGEDWVENLHHNLSGGLQVAVILHLLGIFGDALFHKRRTWNMSIKGRLN